MSQPNPNAALVEDEFEQPGPGAPTLPMGTKLFTVTQGSEDLERLRKAYGAEPLRSGAAD